MRGPCDKWARYAFECDIKSNHLINNVSECFNNYIKDERDKPILTMLEHLRRKSILRFLDKWDEVENLKDSITPYARQTLTKNKRNGRKLQVIHGRGDWYETVNKRGKKMLVNIGEATYDSGMWQVSKLSCKHVVAIFMYNTIIDSFHMIMSIDIIPMKLGS
ncbi:hypothetical protein Dsin_030084 [Dipteronia sinensis]|uniref:SWIM-type domain-containing protein n=1 Tax=Dipteronia sinensis TaxID=43782 RepID=A0AAD9ZI62_9ROSI|nr:hypothetical protein Dsin_030084 [Dipteronia sinensis]